MRILTFISDEVNLTFDEIKDMNINGIKNINNISSDEIILTIAAEINNFYDKYLLSYSKMGLEKIIESSGKVFEFGEIKEFTSMMLVQLFSILDFNNRGVIDSNSAIVASSLDEDYVILAAAGKLKDTCKTCGYEKYVTISKINEVKIPYKTYSYNNYVLK